MREDDLFWIDIQWFAAEDEGRTEDATDEKLRKAREEGKVAKSQDLGAVFGLLGPFIFFIIFSHYILSGLLDLVSSYYTHLADWDITQNRIALTSIFLHFFKATWGILLVALIVCLFINIVQVGLSVSTKAIEFKLDKISPNIIKWAKKSIFSGEALFNLFKSLAKVVVIIAIGYVIIKRNMPTFVRISEFPAMVGISLLGDVVVQIFLFSFLVLLVFAVADYFFQRKVFQDSMKMTKQEIKEEHKQMEGDPLLKSRIKEKMRQIVNQNIHKVVPQADVIITNPTHFAVALQWDSQRMVAPQVIAKGVDELALAIRKVAEDAKVPRVENKPLARALYASVDIGEEVPPEYWELVSQILAEVYTLNEKMKI